MINFIKEHIFLLLTFLVIIFLFLSNTSQGERFSAIGQIICAIFFELDFTSSNVCRK